MLLPFRLGIGGPLGTGRQYWSWIHLDDWVALLAWLATSTGAGTTAVSVWNATAPAPVTNAEFSRVLGRVLHRPAVIPVPGFALRLVLGEFAEFVTTGARVYPVRADGAGFRFRFETLEPALRDLLSASRSHLATPRG
jgi:NAD dependent epimerase/dehydratase family enzyme